MKESIHKHLLSELERISRSDTVFIICGVTFNFVVLFINWAQASQLISTYSEPKMATYLIFIIFIFIALIVTIACLLNLVNSRNICNECQASLEKIYDSSGVNEFIPQNMKNLGKRRFTLSFIIVGGSCVIAVLVPLVTVLFS